MSVCRYYWAMIIFPAINFLSGGENKNHHHQEEQRKIIIQVLSSLQQLSINFLRSLFAAITVKKLYRRQPGNEGNG